MSRFLLSNRFAFGVLVVAMLAFFFPEPGARGGWLCPEWTAKVGVFVIFLLQGLVLPTEELARGLSRWRAHAFAQGYMFVVMPLLAWGLSAPFAETLGPALAFGWVFLGVLPCTISTAVIYTTKAGGSPTVALFNTSVANVAGVFIVPAFYVWWTQEAGEAPPAGPLLAKISVLLLLPLMLGQAARPFAKTFVERRRHWPGRINPWIIYFIIYTSFAQAVTNRFWETVAPSALWLVLAGTVVYVVVGWGLAALLLRAVSWPWEDRIAVFFCATQKTVAAGVPLANSLVALSDWDAGVVLLPLLCYSVAQLSLGGLIVGVLERKSGAGR